MIGTHFHDRLFKERQRYTPWGRRFWRAFSWAVFYAVIAWFLFALLYDTIKWG